MSIFAVQLRFVPEQNDRRLRARPEHREYLAALRDEGKLVNAGPFESDGGALLLYRVPSEADVREILANDPYPSEVYEITLLQEWKPLFDWPVTD